MKPGRRLFAFVAIFAIAFGSLWPLVSAAKPRTPQIPSFICSQGGLQHAPVPDGGDEHIHCPLCVVLCDIALPKQLASTNAWVPAFSISCGVAVVESSHSRLRARPPPSHAPPALS
jgi:Protein of unknown function (DUF2946)